MEHRDDGLVDPRRGGRLPAVADVLPGELRPVLLADAPRDPTFQPAASSSDFAFAGSNWLNCSTPLSYHLTFDASGPYVGGGVAEVERLRRAPRRSIACEIACRTRTSLKPRSFRVQSSAIQKFASAGNSRRDQAGVGLAGRLDVLRRGVLHDVDRSRLDLVGARADLDDRHPLDRVEVRRPLVVQRTGCRVPGYSAQRLTTTAVPGWYDASVNGPVPSAPVTP